MSQPSCGEKVEPQHKSGVPSHFDEPLYGPKPSRVACPQCGKTFATNSEMERHRSTIHMRGQHG